VCVRGNVNKSSSDKGLKMKVFLSGVVVGILIATVGVSGIARIMDNGINKTKEIAIESAK
jgi:hypothetical protein